VKGSQSSVNLHKEKESFDGDFDYIAYAQKKLIEENPQKN
jgi:hypothetical protein